MIISSCFSNKITTYEKYTLENIQNKKGDTLLNSIIKPYKEKINLDLQDTISFSIKTMTKKTPDGELGNYIADLCMNKYNRIADFCVINNGGIRSSLDSGYITKKNIYKIMPFDNKLVVVEMNHQDIQKLVTYLSKNKEPISGIKIKNGNIKIYDYKNKSWHKITKTENHNDKIFQVITSDYLSNGGDNMFFFKNKDKKNTGELLRDLMIEHISKKDTVKYTNSKRYD